MTFIWTTLQPLTWSPTNILPSKLKRDGWTVRFMRNLLNSHTQNAMVNGFRVLKDISPKVVSLRSQYSNHYYLISSLMT